MTLALFPEARLQEARTLFFPLIGETPEKRLITGYNVYDETEILPETAKFNVHYLHANLAKDDTHKQQFEEKLKDYGLVHLLPRISESVITRNASYYTQPAWVEEDTDDVRYFDTRGSEIVSIEDFDGTTIIAEQKQYDWHIGVETREDLRRLNNFLRNHTYLDSVNSYGKRILDSSGRVIKNSEENLLGNNTWDIPLVVIGMDPFERIRGYRQIRKIDLKRKSCRDICDTTMLISLLIDKRFARFIKELESSTEKYPFMTTITKKSTNCLFIDEYINS
jgi:hypothetical protein